MSYRQIVEFCYEFTKRILIASDVVEEIYISVNSVNTWFKFLCQVCKDTVDKDVIGGPGVVVKLMSWIFAQLSKDKVETRVNHKTGF